MEGPPLGPGGEDITWPDQVAPRGRKASSTRKIKPQTSNLRGRGGAPHSPERTVTPGGGCSWIRTPCAPAPPTACSRGGCDRRASPHQRARTMHRPRPGAARDDEPEQYGGRAPHDQSIANDARNVAR